MVFFNQYKADHNLDERSFIDCIVKFVQHIPYVSLTCDTEPDTLLIPADDYITLTEFSFGILPPLICLSLELGDCDTKSLLLYILLNHYKIKTAMLHFESPIISHSIVGISHRSLNEGLHIIDNSATIPYYLLDTTSQLKIGFMFDVLFEDVTKWKLVLPPLKLVSNYSGFPKTKFKRV